MYRSLGKCIAVIHKNLNYYLNKKLEKFNVKSDQLEIIHTLNAIKGLSQNALGEILLEDKITITKRLKGLEQEGYIERRVDSKDKRIKKLYLTDKGHELSEISREIIEESSDILTENLSDDAKKCLKDILPQMSKNIFDATSKFKKS